MPVSEPMHFVSAVSERLDTRAAVREAAAQLRTGRSRPPDLVLVYASPHHADGYAGLGAFIREELGAPCIAGCSAAGVIGAGRELEQREGLSLTAAWLPDTRVHIVHVVEPPPVDALAAWRELIDARSGSTPHFIVLADPAGCDTDKLLQGLDAAFPDSMKVGGLASGASNERPCALFVDQDVRLTGALLVVLDGGIEVHTVVAQGCRPVGEPHIVTRARGNVIHELNAGKPTEVLRKLYDSMDARDLALFNSSLFVGIEMGDKGGRYEHGDFLIRSVLGIDREGGAMAIDARVQDYQVIQFHMRDRDASAQDLTQRLRNLPLPELAPRIRGSVLFSCLGRGERLYGVPNHDSDTFVRRVSSASLSGFFCNGEIGPVGGKTFVHGYTSVFALFCEPAKANA